MFLRCVRLSIRLHLYPLISLPYPSKTPTKGKMHKKHYKVSPYTAVIEHGRALLNQNTQTLQMVIDGGKSVPMEDLDAVSTICCTLCLFRSLKLGVRHLNMGLGPMSRGTRTAKRRTRARSMFSLPELVCPRRRGRRSRFIR